MSIPIIRYTDADFRRKVDAWRDRLQGPDLLAGGVKGGADVETRIREAIDGVRTKGDKAVAEQTKTIHEAALTPAMFKVPQEDIERAYANRQKENPGFIKVLRRAIANIRRYQESILVRDPNPVVDGGRELSLRYTPIDRVAVYVPGGRAAYPSSLLMTVVPAQVAGVKDIVAISPPDASGKVKEDVLVAAKELGVTTIYRVAGAAGLAAVAYGTETIGKVDKIVGPGSAFIAEAKRQLFGKVGIDSIAGPSEVLIIADDTARPDWLAADLLAQAEHNPGSAILVTPSDKLAVATHKAVYAQLANPSYARSAEAKACIEAFGAIIVVRDLPAACQVANDFAPEHLQIITADDDKVLAGIRNAGAIFLGPCTPVPLGDYLAGPSHVLPTGGTARFFGPLSCNDFLKASSVIRYDAASLAADAADVIDFATREGLTAHANAIRIRNPESDII